MLFAGQQQDAALTRQQSLKPFCGYQKPEEALRIHIATSWIKSLIVINICNTACQSPAEVSQVPLSCQRNEQAPTCSSTSILFIICVQQLRHLSN